MKRCIIANPSAGTAGPPEDLRAKFRALDPIEFFLTADAGDAKRFAEEAVRDGYDMIIIAGGDGTLNEVINGVAPHEAGVALALAPSGTGNDFGRALGLPDTLEACLDLVVAGQTRPIDVVRVTSDQVRYFLNVSAGGFSGVVDEKMTPEMKQSWGPLAYLRGAAAALPELRAYRTKITLDDAEIIEENLYNIVIANGRFVAGGIPITPAAELDDGLLDIVLIPDKSGAAALTILGAQVLLGTHLESDAIIFRRAAKIGVQSRPGMWFNVDGELVGNEPAVFEVLPRAINFVAPQKT
ncbi:MAG: diacylglycerol kinase family lipid kinase [Chthoniobacterales bacterium]|nr:diacylglycerol kinase family lipid kinase [Chthoniobacterales bacterium]